MAEAIHGRGGRGLDAAQKAAAARACQADTEGSGAALGERESQAEAATLVLLLEYAYYS